MTAANATIRVKKLLASPTKRVGRGARYTYYILWKDLSRGSGSYLRRGFSLGRLGMLGNMARRVSDRGDESEAGCGRDARHKKLPQFPRQSDLRPYGQRMYG